MKGGDFSWRPLGTFPGHQRRPQLATSRYFLMATDSKPKSEWIIKVFIARLARHIKIYRWPALSTDRDNYFTQWDIQRRHRYRVIATVPARKCF